MADVVVKTPMQYLDRAVGTLRDMGLMPTKVEDATINGLLQQISDLDADRITVIARTLGQASVFNEVVRDQISGMQIAEHREVALAVAEQAVVLLKNDAALLPLDPQGIRRAVVIGCDADSAAAAGGGSGKIRPAFEVSLLDGIRQRLGAAVQVDYCQGNDPVSAADLLPGNESIPSCFLRADDEPGTRGLRAEFWTNTDFVGDPFTTCVMPQAALNLGFFNFPGFGAASPKYPALPFELTGRISARFSSRIVVPVDG